MSLSTSQSLIVRVLDWLRAGYPAGVPREDHVALLGILHRTLTETEIDALAAELASAGQEAPGDEEIASLIRKRVLEQAHPGDIARVSARLAQGGWPLAAPAQVESTSEQSPGRIQRIVDWLREGYPAGVPPTDFVPLVALLRRRLTDEEVKAVATELRKAGISPVGPADIGAEITRVTNELPSNDDIRRVHDRLAKKGWPLEFPDPAPHD